MGGLTLTVRQVTGKDPDGYFNDLRNHHRTRVQEMKQAIGVEARTTILNPTYIKEVTKEGQGAASALAETIRNTYGWNVMKPSAIDKELWDDIYNTYIKDDKDLGIRDFFEQNNPPGDHGCDDGDHPQGNVECLARTAKGNCRATR